MKTKFHCKIPYLIEFFFFLILTLFVLGCASDNGIMRQDIMRMESEITRLQKKIQQLEKADNEQKYAELQNQLDTLNTELQAVNAKADDITQRLEETNQTIARLRRLLQSHEQRIAEIEKELVTRKENQRVSPPPIIQNDITGTSSSLEAMYNDAYLSFTRANYPEARKKFKAFLKKYPKTVYSDNARFWIGETFYLEGDFESAILEYEKVIKEYPRGDKVPSALLKEGLAFIKLGDKTDGKLVLKKLIKRYPRTDQAKIAKRILQKLK